MLAWYATCAPSIAALVENYGDPRPSSAHQAGEPISHRHALSWLLRTRHGDWDYYARGAFPRSDPHGASAILVEYHGLCRALGTHPATPGLLSGPTHR